VIHAVVVEEVAEEWAGTFRGEPLLPMAALPLRMVVLHLPAPALFPPHLMEAVAVLLRFLIHLLLMGHRQEHQRLYPEPLPGAVARLLLLILLL